MTIVTAQQTLPEVLTQVESIVAPLWPLEDFVAVNPYLGMVESDFLETRQWLRAVGDMEVLMPIGYFQEMYRAGAFGASDLERAIDECREAYPVWYEDLSAEELSFYLAHPEGDREAAAGDRRIWTFAERIDGHCGTCWTTTIVNEISRHCAAHFDQGQALWSSPWKHLPLYEAWREIARIDRRMDRLGVPGFNRFVAGLPASPTECIARLLHALRVPEDDWKNFLACELFSIPGWASYCQYQSRQKAAGDGGNESLLGLLAIRLAYDAALLLTDDGQACACDVSHSGFGFAQPAPTRDALRRYALQVAAEIAFRRNLCTSVAEKATTTPVRKLAQMVFCIDVRSEVIRRSLEAVNSQVETFGFAGFFGVPVERIPLGASRGPAQCPVLLTPSFRVEETIRGATPRQRQHGVERRQATRLWRKTWKLFRTSAASCFSFVESLGMLYIVDLIRDTFLLRRAAHEEASGVAAYRRRAALIPSLEPSHDLGIAGEDRVTLAQGILQNLGLLGEFAPLVVFCGHGSETANNPYAASLDCGACGGHTGGFNAQVAAALLNDGEVRHRLADRGICIPEDTIFVAAQHNTTTDDIVFFDADHVQAAHPEAFGRLIESTRQAGVLARAERGLRMDARSQRLVLRRSRDWSEVRPEWGLAGNAAFVVAPRARTIGRNLNGRTFLHSYDHRRDPEFKTLELIMTAPMIVTNWINLQYYASTVDNRAFGSGNKAIHNVVGNTAVLQGNGGDVMTGLPWQSIHDGKQLQHQPLRLLVVIEAARTAIQAIIDKHPLVRDLAGNGWLSILAIDEEEFYRYSAHRNWTAVALDENELPGCPAGHPGFIGANHTSSFVGCTTSL